jgi:hypothetical protein
MVAVGAQVWADALSRLARCFVVSSQCERTVTVGAQVWADALSRFAHAQTPGAV